MILSTPRHKGITDAAGRLRVRGGSAGKAGKTRICFIASNSMQLNAAYFHGLLALNIITCSSKKSTISWNRGWSRLTMMAI